jgi:hypothetical protein
MSCFKIEDGSLVPLGHLKAEMCKVVGGKENVVEEDYNQDWQCIENILTGRTMLAAKWKLITDNLLPLLLMCLSILSTGKVDLTVDGTDQDEKA